MFSKAAFKLGILLALLALGCSLTGTVPDTGAPSATPVGQFSVDDIAVDYVYTSELITIIYPLYGDKLDDFVIVTIANHNAAPAKVVVRSEIAGYTTEAVDTVEVQAGETLEVRQNPRLIPEKIEELNVEKPAQVHIRVTALVEGVEKPLL
ncbi:MAG: hypothetical protein AB1846_17745, partial [Chloroflexota bacterium]